MGISGDQWQMHHKSQMLHHNLAYRSTKTIATPPPAGQHANHLLAVGCEEGPWCG